MNKIIFGINVTENKKNDQTDHQPLVSKRLSEWKQQELSKTIEEAEDLTKRASLSKPLLIIKTVLFIVMIILATSILSSILKGITFQTAYHNAAFLFYILPVSFLGWIVLIIYEKTLTKKYEGSYEVENLVKRTDIVITNSADEFNVPEDAISMDFLAFRYKRKNDAIKLVSTYLMMYVVVSQDVFVREDKLCFANLKELIELSLKDFVSIECVQKNAIISNWNKDTPYNKEPYKKYKLKSNQDGMIYVKPYYIVSFNVNGQVYDLYVPVYEIADFVKRTGIDYHDQFTSDETRKEESL